MKVLVTGSTGRLGIRLRRRLLDGPHDGAFLGGMQTPDPSGTCVSVEITDRDALTGAIVGAAPDVVVHLASLNLPQSAADPELAERVNVDGTRNVVDASREAGARRIIFASSAAVYGDGYRDPVAETHPVALDTVYGRTKFDAEQIVAAAHAGSVDTLSLRIFNVFGPGFADSLVNRLLASTPDAPVTLFGLDQFVRDYSQVDAIIEGLHAALDAPLDGHSTINLASGTPTSNRMLVEKLAERGPLHYTVRDDPPSYSCADITVARRILGYTPQPV
jgi:nucleoside-diphosphate-sugar epimerase